MLIGPCSGPPGPLPRSGANLKHAKSPRACTQGLFSSSLPPRLRPRSLSLCSPPWKRLHPLNSGPTSANWRAPRGAAPSCRQTSWRPLGPSFCSAVEARPARDFVTLSRHPDSRIAEMFPVRQAGLKQNRPKRPRSFPSARATVSPSFPGGLNYYVNFYIYRWALAGFWLMYILSPE